MQFKIFVQDLFYKNLEAENSGKVLAIVADDIKNGLVPGFDPSRNHDIRIVPNSDEN